MGEHYTLQSNPKKMIQRGIAKKALVNQDGILKYIYLIQKTTGKVEERDK